MSSLAAKDPNRLVMCTADSSGILTPACRGGDIDLPSPAGGGGGGLLSSMRGPTWGTRCALRRRSRCRDGVAPNEQLRRDRSRYGGRRLVANFGEADRADQAA